MFYLYTPKCGSSHMKREIVNGVRTGEVEVRDENDKTMTILGNGKRRNEKKMESGKGKKQKRAGRT